MKKVFIGFIFLLGALSCKKSFLEVEDNGNNLVPAQQYIKDLTSLQQYLNGVYATIGASVYQGAAMAMIYPDLVADNIKLSGAASFLVAQYNWNQASSTNINDGSVNYWTTAYRTIRSCSFIIEKAVEFSSEDMTKSKRMQAEAYSLRALIYFVLVNTYAQSYNYTPGGSHPGVPYITTYDWRQSYIRNTVAEVYEGMINDLKAGIPLFTAGPRNTLIMNQNTAKALLARIYLFKEDWVNAKKTALEVATDVPLMTGSAYPVKLFTLQETEALFQLPPISTALLSNTQDTYFAGWFFRSPARFLATRDIADLLTQNPNDARRNWILSGGVGKDSIIKYPVNVVPGFATGPTDMTNPARSYYQTLFRSSEMFLTVSEAAAKEGDENTARIYLDAIRKRADPAATSATESGADLLNIIYTERRKELAFEGFRMYDLLRWKQGVNRLDVTPGSPATLSYPNNKAIAPVPVSDVQNGISQNPGY